ncbi:MAG: Asp/Glu/hydantoin racemase, partial [Alphaproteobacteria bacterium]|nr:Asp/Glu/hydantoin racemase [Alphaproteobacteria bacterium]
MAGSDQIERCAARLAGHRPNAVAYACGTASYVGGFGSDRKISERIRAQCAAPATTTSTEMVNALRAFGVRRIAVLSPHIDALNERL